MVPGGVAFRSVPFIWNWSMIWSATTIAVALHYNEDLLLINVFHSPWPPRPTPQSVIYCLIVVSGRHPNPIQSLFGVKNFIQE